MSLATIEKIVSIEPHPDPEVTRIEIVRVLGYQSVVSKGLHHVGELIGWINPDTLVKRANWNKFLWPKNDIDGLNGGDIRIKTVRIRGQLSEGLVVSLNNFSNINRFEGVDISDALGVFKYEKTAIFKLQSIQKGNYPSHILPKTDEPRIKNFPLVLSELNDTDIVIRLKYDGSSSLFMINNNEYQVGSRSFLLKEGDNNPWWYVSKKYNIREKLISLGVNIALNAECIGPQMNGNKLKLMDKEIAIFNAYCIDERRYLNDAELENLCLKTDLPIARKLYSGKNVWYNIEDLQSWTNNVKYDCGEWAEGVVVRTKIEKYSNVLRGRFSFKVLNENFLLKYKE